MEELKRNQPFHQNNHGTCLEIRRVTRFTRSGANKPFYNSQAAQYLEAHGRNIIEMANADKDPITGSQMEYEDLIKDPKL